MTSGLSTSKNKRRLLKHKTQTYNKRRPVFDLSPFEQDVVDAPKNDSVAKSNVEYEDESENEEVFKEGKSEKKNVRGITLYFPKSKTKNIVDLAKHEYKIKAKVDDAFVSEFSDHMMAEARALIRKAFKLAMERGDEEVTRKHVAYVVEKGR